MESGAGRWGAIGEELKSINGPAAPARPRPDGLSILDEAAVSPGWATSRKVGGRGIPTRTHAAARGAGIWINPLMAGLH